MSDKGIQTLNIKAEGELPPTPDIAGMIQACVKQHSEDGKKGGALFFDGLYILYSYGGRPRPKKAGRKKREVKA